MDPRAWDLPGLLAALETALDRSAKDETERSRNHRALYRPPSGVSAPAVDRRPQGLSSTQAQALLALAD